MTLAERHKECIALVEETDLLATQNAALAKEANPSLPQERLLARFYVERSALFRRICEQLKLAANDVDLQITTEAHVDRLLDAERLAETDGLVAGEDEDLEGTRYLHLANQDYSEAELNALLKKLFEH